MQVKRVGRGGWDGVEAHWVLGGYCCTGGVWRWVMTKSLSVERTVLMGYIERRVVTRGYCAVGDDEGALNGG